MLVLKIPSGEHLTIYDRTDGSMPPIVIKSSGGDVMRIAIDADPRYAIVRSDAKCDRRREGGKDARPISA